MFTLLPVRGLAYAICWTLIHSLWIGVFSAVLAGIAILCTRRLPAVVRHRLLLADLLVSVAVIGAIFCREANAIQQEDTGAGASGHGMVVAWEGEAAPPISPAVPVDRLALVSSYLDNHALFIVSVWLLCLSFQLFRLLAGLGRLKQIRKEGQVITEDRWIGLISELSARLGIRRSVVLVESLAIAVPAAIGMLKPVILVPAGMLAGMPADQVETILLHELAHIRRGDYWINLLLHITDALFFFNPALRWLSGQIRREREACCDDMVLLHTPDRTAYLEALVAFKERMVGARTEAYAVRLTGEKNPLLSRVLRMLTKENKTLNTMEKTILSMGLAAVITIGLLSMKPAPAPAAVPKPQSPASHVTVSEMRLTSAPDPTPAVPVTAAQPTPSSAPSQNTSTAAVLPQRQTTASRQADRVRVTAVSDTAPKLTQDTAPQRIQGKDTLFRAKRDQDAKMRKLQMEMQVLQRLQEEQLKIKLQIEKDKQQLMMENDKFQLQARKLEIEKEESELKDINASERAEVVVVGQPRAQKVIMVQGRGQQLDSVKAMSRSFSQNKHTYVAKATWAASGNTTSDVVQHIIQNLVNYGLVPDPENLTFTLNWDKLVVNGEKIPDHIHEKFKNEFVKTKKTYFKYARDKKGGTISTDVSIEQ